MKIVCRKCAADITESYQPDDWSVGIVGGWYCDACDIAIGEGDVEREPFEGDLPVGPVEADRPLGTPISQLSGRPGHPGYEEFRRIARSWGYD